MARQEINLGTSANSGTGDPIRTGGAKINDNFIELYNDIVSLISELALKLDASGLGVSIAELVAGKVPISQLPATVIVDVFPVASEAAMLALSTAEQGDIAIRSDINKTFVLAASPPSVLGNWLEMLFSGEYLTLT
mgnify:FL=1